MNDIVINNIRVESCNNDKNRLIVTINIDGCKRDLYYEVDSEFGQYLDAECYDAFVLGLLHEAMYSGRNIQVKGSVSERLLFQINQYYIPLISKKMPDLQYIEIKADKLIGKNYAGNGVATGCSGGVDSFYTIIKYTNAEYKNHNVKYLMFNNISTADFDDARIRKLYERDAVDKKKIADELGMIPIFLYTNLYSFYSSQFIYNFYFASQYISAAYALNRLISVYYFSSAHSFGEFTINYDEISDSSSFDLFSLVMFSSENLKVYSSGSEVERIDKTKYIAGNNTVRRHLQVCSEEQYIHFYEKNKSGKLDKLNCGKCRKCIRTISTLYSIGELENYKDVFDLSLFEKNRCSFVGKEMAIDLQEFSRDIIDEMKGNGLYSARMRIWKWYWVAYEMLRKKTRRNRLIRKILGKKPLDE